MNIIFSFDKFLWKPHLFKWYAVSEKDANYYGSHKFFELSWLWFDIEIYIK